MNPYVVIAALLVWIGSSVGSFLYARHIDSMEVQDAEDRISQAAAHSVLVAQEAAEKKTQSAQAQADKKAQDLLARFAQERKQYAAQHAHDAEALSHLPACPVPRDDISVLLSAPGDNRAKEGNTGNPGSAGASPDNRTVDAGQVILTCEVNKAAFERNAERLQSCISLYDNARKLCN